MGSNIICKMSYLQNEKPLYILAFVLYEEH
jgi:hypothetical protein